MSAETSYDTTETLVKGNPKKGMIGATLGFFIGFAAVVALGATSSFFEAEFLALGSSGSLIGLLVAMPNLSGSLLRIPFAAWSDSVGSRKPLLVLLMLSLVGLIGIVIVIFTNYPGFQLYHYPLLLILGFLAGCGIATFSVGISQVSYWYPQKEQGKALGTYAGIGNTAPGIFSLVMAISLGLFSFSSTNGLGESYLLWFILLLIGTGLYFILGLNAWSFQLEAKGLSSDEAKKIAREYGQDLFPAHNLTQSLKSSASIWQTWALVGLYFTSFGGFIALAAWLPKYWISYFSVGGVSVLGITLGVALLLNSVFVILGSLVRVYSGGLADRITGERTIFSGLLFLLVGAAVMIVSTQDMMLVAFGGMLLVSTGMGAINAGVFKLVPKVAPDSVGGAAGWVGGFGAFGGFVIPPVMGAFVDSFGVNGYAWGYVTFAVLAVMSLVITWILKKSNN